MGSWQIRQRQTPSAPTRMWAESRGAHCLQRGEIMEIEKRKWRGESEFQNQMRTFSSLLINIKRITNENLESYLLLVCSCSRSIKRLLHKLQLSLSLSWTSWISKIYNPEENQVMLLCYFKVSWHLSHKENKASNKTKPNQANNKTLPQSRRHKTALAFIVLSVLHLAVRQAAPNLKWWMTWNQLSTIKAEYGGRPKQM